MGAVGGEVGSAECLVDKLDTSTDAQRAKRSCVRRRVRQFLSLSKVGFANPANSALLELPVDALQFVFEKRTRRRSPSVIDSLIDIGRGALRQRGR